MAYVSPAKEAATKAVHWKQLVRVILLDDVANGFYGCSVLVEGILRIEVVQRIGMGGVAWKRGQLVESDKTSAPKNKPFEAVKSIATKKLICMLKPKVIWSVKINLFLRLTELSVLTLPARSRETHILLRQQNVVE